MLHTYLNAAARGNIFSDGKGEPLKRRNLGKIHISRTYVLCIKLIGLIKSFHEIDQRTCFSDRYAPSTIPLRCRTNSRENAAMQASKVSIGTDRILKQCIVQKIIYNKGIIPRTFYRLNSLKYRIVKTRTTKNTPIPLRIKRCLCILRESKVSKKQGQKGTEAYCRIMPFNVPLALSMWVSALVNWERFNRLSMRCSGMAGKRTMFLEFSICSL